VECESKSDTSNNGDDWNHFKMISGNNEIKEIQKTAVLGTAHIIQSANVKVQNIFHGQNNITCSTNCKYRTSATLYTLETWFVSGI